jgi:hypothetical protein
MKIRSNTKSRIAALATLAGLTTMTSAQTINVVALNVDVAPGVSGGFFATSFLDNPVIDAAGGIAFRSNMIINGTTVTAVNQRGIWYGTPGNLTLAVRSGDQAPGMSAGVVMNTATSGVGLGAPVRMNSNGQMLFGSILTGTGIPRRARTIRPFSSAARARSPKSCSAWIRRRAPASSSTPRSPPRASSPAS